MTELLPIARHMKEFALLLVSASADPEQGNIFELLPVVRYAVLFAALVVCAYTDIAKSKIYNWVTGPAILAGLVLNYWQGGVWSGSIWQENLVSSFIGLGIAGGIFMWPYMKGGLGGGDVKLIAAVGALGGMKDRFIIYALLYSALVGAFMAIALLVWKGRLWEGLKGTFKFAFKRKAKTGEATPSDSKPKLYVPYGLAISLGTIIAWFLLHWSLFE